MSRRKKRRNSNGISGATFVFATKKSGVLGVGPRVYRDTEDLSSWRGSYSVTFIVLLYEGKSLSGGYVHLLPSSYSTISPTLIYLRVRKDKLTILTLLSRKVILNIFIREQRRLTPPRPHLLPMLSYCSSNSHLNPLRTK